MNDMLQAIYFPFTTITSPVMEILTGYFDRVILYQPVGSVPSSSLRHWVDDGLLDIRVPFAGIVDQNLVTAGFTNWKSWGSMHEGADLAYFKEMGQKLPPTEPMTHRLVSEIKGDGGKVKDKSHAQDLTIQLFLLLAQDYDQQSADIQEQLTHIDLQKRNLEEFFRIDSPEQEDNPVSKGSFSKPKEDLGQLMTKTRMIAWNHLFQKTPAPSSVLVTDSPAAVDFLLEDREEKIRTFRLPMPNPAIASEGFFTKADLASLCRDLLTKPWNEQRKRHIETTRNSISATATPGNMPAKDPAGSTPTFPCHLVPHVGTARLLNQQCMKNQHIAQNATEKNTLIGLVEMDRTGHPG